MAAVKKKTTKAAKKVVEPVEEVVVETPVEEVVVETPVEEVVVETTKFAKWWGNEGLEAVRKGKSRNRIYALAARAAGKNGNVVAKEVSGKVSIEGNCKAIFLSDD